MCILISVSLFACRLFPLITAAWRLHSERGRAFTKRYESGWLRVILIHLERCYPWRSERTVALRSERRLKRAERTIRDEPAMPILISPKYSCHGYIRQSTTEIGASDARLTHTNPVRWWSSLVSLARHESVDSRWSLQLCQLTDAVFVRNTKILSRIPCLYQRITNRVGQTNVHGRSFKLQDANQQSSPHIYT